MSWLGDYYRNHMWFKQLVDQTGHFLGAGLILAPSVWGQFWASAALLGALREVEQIKAKRLVTDRWWEGWTWHKRRTIDVAFWGIGGLALSLVVWLT